MPAETMPFPGPTPSDGVVTIRSMTRIGTTLLALFALTAVVLIAFGLSVAPTATDTVTGEVVSVEPASVTTIASLTLIDDAGREWKFEGGGTFAGLTPSHLEEHRALGEQVTVEYEETGAGTLKILNVLD
ncbi:MAG: hypothetical protein O6922_01740 [Chloroflexi bacterium]|nr:hypothetical protein [Chloroflexota bacterium]